MTGQRYGFFRNTFHQTAVSVNNISIMAAQIITESGSDKPFGNGHADCGRDPLPQRSGRHINSVQMSVFRMPGGFASPLAELFDLFTRQVQMLREGDEAGAADLMPAIIQSYERVNQAIRENFG